MPYCSNCGTEMQEGAKFCPACGTTANGQPNPANEKKSGGLHCPHCGSHNLSPVVVNSLRVMNSRDNVGGVSWICQNCGQKFRNPDDEIKELQTMAKFMKTTICIVFGIMTLFLVMAMSMSGDFFLAPVIILVAIPVLASKLIDMFAKKKIAKADELRKKCYD